MPPKRKQTRPIKNKAPKIKHQCKQSKKRTGESLEEIINKSLVRKRESKFTKAAKLGLKLGVLGAGIYGFTHGKNILDKWDEAFETQKEEASIDDLNKNVDQIIYDLKKNPDSDIAYGKNVIKILNNMYDKIAEHRTPIIHKPDEGYSLENHGMADIPELTPDGLSWSYTMNRLKKYYKFGVAKDAIKQRDIIIDYIEKLRNEYNEACYNQALNNNIFSNGPINSIKAWIKDPSLINYKDIAYWLPKTKNMIWSKKPGTHISDLEGNVAEYLKTEDGFRNMVENAKNTETGEADRQKLGEIKQYMEALVKRYKETFNLT